MWLILLQDAWGKERPLPGVRSTAFAFHSEREAEEFASTLHSRFGAGNEVEHADCIRVGICTCQGVHTSIVRAGEATEVFPDWSF